MRSAAQLSFLAEVAPTPATAGPPAVRIGQRVWVRRGYLEKTGPLEPCVVIDLVATRFTVRFERDGGISDLTILTYEYGRWLEREPTAEEAKPPQVATKAARKAR
jgi:hypothetical protein